MGILDEIMGGQGSDELLGGIIMQNQHAKRNRPLSDRLVNDLSFLDDMGLDFEVFSGGNNPKAPVGTHRHDGGNAGDGFLRYKGGRRLDPHNPKDIPVLQEAYRRGEARGIKGWGQSDGYMLPGSIHIGYGTPAVWGKGGKGANAAPWLKAAARGQTGGGVEPASYEPPRLEPAPPKSPFVENMKAQARPQGGPGTGSLDAPVTAQAGTTRVPGPMPRNPTMYNPTDAALTTQAGATRVPVDVRSAAQEYGPNAMRPTSFQQLAARQAAEGDPSQRNRLMQAAGLDQMGQRRLEPRGTGSPGLWDLLKQQQERMASAPPTVAPKVPGAPGAQMGFGGFMDGIGGLLKQLFG